MLLQFTSGMTSGSSLHSSASVVSISRPADTTFSSYRFCDSTERLLDFCSIISILRISFIAVDNQTMKSRQTREFTDKIWFKSFATSILSPYYLTHSRTSLKCCTSRRRKERYLPRTKACPIKWRQIRVLQETPTPRPRTHYL